MTVVNVDYVPLKTRSGWILTIPVRPPSAAIIAARRSKYEARRYFGYTVCDFCARQEFCNAIIAAWSGDFIGCEWPLERELIDDG